MFDIHHNDENHHNNNWSNLRCVCAWCHIKHHRNVERIGELPLLLNDQYKLPLVEKKVKEKIPSGKCLHCQKDVFGNKYCSHQCYSEASRKIERPNKDELERMVNTSSLSYVGRQYGVSSNAIKKWCITAGIPLKTRPYSIKNKRKDLR